MFGTGTLNEVTGWSRGYVQKLIRDGVIPMTDEDRKAGEDGRNRAFGWHTVTFVYVLALGTKLGVPLEDARQAATKFAFLGNSQGEIVTRFPSCLFARGDTALVWRRRADGSFAYKIVPADQETSFSRLMLAFDHADGRMDYDVDGAIVLMLREPMLRLCDMLKLPHSVLQPSAAA